MRRKDRLWRRKDLITPIHPHRTYPKYSLDGTRVLWRWCDICKTRLPA